MGVTGLADVCLKAPNTLNTDGLDCQYIKYPTSHWEEAIQADSRDPAPHSLRPRSYRHVVDPYGAKYLIIIFLLNARIIIIYHNDYCPKPKYPIIGYLDPLEIRISGI